MKSENTTDLDSIHAKRDGRTSTLNALVVSSHTGEFERLVRERGHGVVGKPLEHSIGDVVRHHQDNGADGDTNSPVPGHGDTPNNAVSTSELDLEAETASPDDAVEEDDKGGGEEGSLPSAEGQVVGHLADDDRANDGAETSEQRNQSASPAVEERRGDGTLVRVEVVGREEHGEQSDHAPVLEQVTQLLELLRRGDGILQLDDGAVAPDDEVGREKEPRGDNGGEHDNHEGEVYTGRDSRQGGMGLNAKGDGGTDQCSHLEEGPEEGERSALVLLERVGHHNRTLSGPEQGSGAAEECASEDEEPSCAVDLVCPESAYVERISSSTDGEGQSRAEHVLRTRTLR